MKLTPRLSMSTNISTLTTTEAVPAPTILMPHNATPIIPEDEIKKLLTLIKSNWKVVILITWMAYITVAILKIGSGISSTNWTVSSIKYYVSSIESDVSEIKSDVSSIESDVSEIKSDVSSIESDVRSTNQEVIGKHSYGTLRYKIENLK